ncbi:MAG: GNAT family N-acetyltransferase [Pseudolabrys sp.]
MLRFILPLALARRSGLTVMTWLAQSHANYGMGLFDRDTLVALDPAQAENLMEEIARHCGADVVHLDNQPMRWAGQPNPFALGRSARLTANDTFIVALADDFEAQYRGLFSSRTRSGLKRKQRRFEETGSVSFDPPATREERLGAIEWFIVEKRRSLAEAGQRSVFDRQAIAGLYRHLAANAVEFDIDRLAVNGMPVAVALTIRGGGFAYFLNTAFCGADFARFSPGALVLHRHVASVHAKGARTFDFGPGALPYKHDWQPETIPLIASSFNVSARGRPLALLLGLGVSTKCAVKRNDRLREMAFAMRRIAGSRIAKAK